MTLAFVRFPSRVLLVLMIAALTLLFSIPAQAHSVLLETTPNDEEQLAGAPASVSLTFNEDITNLGTEVVVTLEDGTIVSEGQVQIEGPTITQALADTRPAGAYTVTWRAVSADGHPISGVFVFTSADPVGQQEEVTPTPEETAAPEGTSAPESTEDATSAPEETETSSPSETSAPADSEPGFAVNTGVLIALVGFGALLLGFAVFYMVRVGKNSASQHDNED